jgi:hypothetical protein
LDPDTTGLFAQNGEKLEWSSEPITDRVIEIKEDMITITLHNWQQDKRTTEFEVSTKQGIYEQIHERTEIPQFRLATAIQRTEPPRYRPISPNEPFENIKHLYLQFPYRFSLSLAQIVHCEYYSPDTPISQILCEIRHNFRSREEL